LPVFDNAVQRLGGTWVNLIHLIYLLQRIYARTILPS
jgi:hypothetical protein